MSTLVYIPAVRGMLRELGEHGAQPVALQYEREARGGRSSWRALYPSARRAAAAQALAALYLARKEAA